MEETKRYTIAYRGLRSGLHDFHFKVDGGLFRAFGSTEIKDGDCDVSVALERGESMLTLDVTVDGSVVVECDRCLEDCNVPIHYEGQLLVKFSDEVHEYDGEVMWLLPMEDEVDLTQYIYESIVLALPYQRVHPDGECNPDMLERFRIVSDEEFGRLEDRAEAEGRNEGEWAKLAALITRLSFRRWSSARTAAQLRCITAYAPNAGSIAESWRSRKRLPNKSAGLKSASARLPSF